MKNFIADQISFQTSLLTMTGAVAAISLPPLHGAIYGAIGAAVGVASSMLTMLASNQKIETYHLVQGVIKGIFSIIIGSIVAFVISEGVFEIAKIILPALSKVDISSIIRLFEFSIGLIAMQSIPLIQVIFLKRLAKLGE